MTVARAAELRDAVATEPDAAVFLTRTRAQGEWLLTQPPLPVTRGNRSLPAVRPILQRLYTLGVLYRVDGGGNGTQWSARAVPELLNAAAAEQWDLDGAASACRGGGNAPRRPSALTVCY